MSIKTPVFTIPGSTGKWLAWKQRKEIWRSLFLDLRMPGLAWGLTPLPVSRPAMLLFHQPLTSRSKQMKKGQDKSWPVQPGFQEEALTLMTDDRPGTSTSEWSIFAPVWVDASVHGSQGRGSEDGSGLHWFKGDQASRKQMQQNFRPLSSMWGNLPRALLVPQSS